MALEIIHNSEDLIAINKPHGLLVHRTPMARDATTFAIQELRDQVGYRVYPSHRLDRKTSGVLLFAKSSETNKVTQELFMNREIKKTYHALVRGFVDDKLEIDYALKNEDKVQEAFTKVTPLKQFEIPYPSTTHPTSRYTWVQLEPETGRYHQLRKHMAHILHPIIGDRPHGCNKQNKIWKEHHNMSNMMLHASELTFEMNGTVFNIQAEVSGEIKEAIEFLEDYK